VLLAWELLLLLLLVSSALVMATDRDQQSRIPPKIMI